MTFNVLEASSALQQSSVFKSTGSSRHNTSLRMSNILMLLTCWCDAADKGSVPCRPCIATYTNTTSTKGQLTCGALLTATSFCMCKVQKCCHEALGSADFYSVAFDP